MLKWGWVGLGWVVEKVNGLKQGYLLASTRYCEVTGHLPRLRPQTTEGHGMLRRQDEK